MNKLNLLENIPSSIPNELIETIAKSKNCKIERIISSNHATPKGKWYNQEQNELVILMKGSAEILFEENKELVKMKEGDYIIIPKHKKHRVEKTDKRTIWLTIFY